MGFVQLSSEKSRYVSRHNWSTAHSFNVKVGHLGFVIDDVDDMDDLKDDLPFIPSPDCVLESNEKVYKQLC